jgi:Mg-chelatase subunit ChlD
MKNTEILVITDRSGSMGSIVRDVIGGYNRFLAEQKAQPGEAKLTYAQFDNEYELVHEGLPLAKAPKLTAATFVPRGGTALYDAIGRTLNAQGERIKREAWAEMVVVCIITDGGENSSRECSREQVAAMVKHAEAHGWKFIFLAANQDAFASARAIGSSAQFAGNFKANAAGTMQAYASSSATLSSLRSGATPNALLGVKGAA